jgi:hypothetical protein
MGQSRRFHRPPMLARCFSVQDPVEVLGSALKQNARKLLGIWGVDLISAPSPLAKHHEASTFNKARASVRSRVSKPSVNQP